MEINASSSAVKT